MSNKDKVTPKKEEVKVPIYEVFDKDYNKVAVCFDEKISVVVGNFLNNVYEGGVLLAPYPPMGKNFFINRRTGEVFLYDGTNYACIEKQIEQSKKIPSGTWLQKQEEELLASLKKEQDDMWGRSHDLLMDKLNGLYPEKENKDLVLRTQLPSDQQVRDWIKDNEELFGFDQNTKLTILAFMGWVKSR